MGACNSCEATPVAADTSTSSPITAKVVLPDGTLQEYAWPVKASHVIHKASPDGTCFLSSSDDLQPGCNVAAVRSDSDLMLGQLYFILPACMLRRRLGSDQMAELALRASAALVGHHKGRPLHFPSTDCSLTTEDTLSRAQAKRKGRSSRGSSRGRDFETDLGAIPEYY